MNCPWCDFTGGPPALHGHLGERHRDAVTRSDRDGQGYYRVTCPLCAVTYQRVLRKGLKDPAFMAEFEPEITLVALDMLVHHLAAEHDQETGERGRDAGQ